MSTDLESSKERLEQKWCALVSAEQEGASIQILERLYSSYILAVEEYNRYAETPQCVRKQKLLPAYIKYPSPTTPTTNNKSKKKAS